MNNLCVGFSRMNVTPMMGIYMQGYYEDRFADGVLDELELNALALSCGQVRTVLISLDSIGIDRNCTRIIKDYICEATGLEREAVYLHATHTHTGPQLRCDSDDPLRQEYFRFICRRMADASVAALNNLKPAKMGWGVGVAPEIAFIRRYRMKDGSLKTNPGVNNPEIEGPVGVVDPRVGVVRFDRECGDHIVLVNYGNHPDVIGGCKISTDWPGHLRREVERSLDDCKCIFFNGAQGDVNHIKVHQERTEKDCMSDSGRWQGYGHSKYMGRALAGTVLQVYDKVKASEVDSIRFAQKTVQIPANLPTPEERVWALRIDEEYRKAGGASKLPYDGLTVVKAERMARLENGPEFFEMEVSAVAIGNIAMVGLPGEAFSKIGIELKKAPGYELVLSTCLTNGCEGYFPTEEDYAEGGYEAVSSRFKPGIAELLVKAGNELMEQLAGK